MQIETLLNISDIERIFSLSKTTIYRKIASARAGQILFPLPVSNGKQRLRWSPAAVARYIESQSASQPQVNVNLPKQQRQEASSVQQRQQRTWATLQRHGILRNSNPKGE